MNRLGPSSSSRWLACPGSVAACAALPAEPSGAAATEGTFAHAVLEYSILLDLPHPPSHIYYQPVPTEMQAGVQIALNYVADWQLENLHGTITSEQQISAESFLEGPVSGTPDIIMATPDVVEVVDLKYGRVQVEAEKNTQMRLYGIAAVCERDMQWPQEFVFTIIQPRGTKFPIDNWSVKAQEVKQWALDVVKPAVKLIKEQGIDAPRHAGDWCKWCRAKTSCQTYVNYVFKGVPL